MLLAEERMSVENTLRESRHEEHQAVERMREEARSFVSHESSGCGMAARQNHPFLGSLDDANTKKTALEQILQEYAQHMALMQQRAAQHISIFEQHDLTLKYDIDRMKFEMYDLMQQSPAQVSPKASEAKSWAANPSRRYSIGTEEPCGDTGG